MAGRLPMAYLLNSKRNRNRPRPVVWLSVLFLALTALVLFGSSPARGEFKPPHGFKSCGSYGPPARRLHLYRKHVSCHQARRVQRAYEQGAPATERGINELCFKNLPGWCCTGGGGAVTCKKHRSVSLSVSV
jgi:hypothetical protein